MEVMKTMAAAAAKSLQSCLTLRHPISFQRSHAYTAALNAPACSKPRPTPLPQTPGFSGASPGQPLLGSLLLSPGSWCTRFCVCPPRVYFPVLCKFWQLCGGVNGNLLEKVPFRHCYTQCPQPCSRPSPTHTSAGDSWTLLGKSGSVSCGGH